jgi:ribonuclease J
VDTTLKILPMGGVGEMGMNLTLYGVGDDYIIVDAGVQFADPSMVGAELTMPDLDLLAEYRDRVQAIVLTHGHEDHIGAVEYVVGILKVPVYAPPFVCELLRLKANEYGAVARADLRPVTPGHVVTAGVLSIEFVRVTHSIPDCHALVLRTPVGTLIHTGDFKIDPDPLDGQHFDTERFRQLGDEGVRMLLSDSTNAEVAGHSRPDREVIAELERRIAEAEGRVIVALFSSNVYRIRALVEAATRCGRRACLIGKSLLVYQEAAQRAFKLPPLPDLVDSHQLHRVHDRGVVVICTGSQAEPRAVLYRASVNDHPDLRIKEGDLVMMSARQIPGNEQAIHRMANNLARQGARIVHDRMAPIHGSGHAQREELAEMIRLVRPQTFVPIHGEFAFLRAHGELATEIGVTDVRLIENGHVLEVTRDDAVVTEHVPLTFHYLDTPIVGDAKELVLEERKRIGWTGVVAARLKAERGRRRWKTVVDLHSVGVPMAEEALLDEAAAHSADQVADLPLDSTRKQLEEALVAALRSFFRKKMDRKPAVLSFVELLED